MNSSTSECGEQSHAGDITKKEAEAGILPSHGWSSVIECDCIHLLNFRAGIAIDVPGQTEYGRPPLIKHL